MYYIRDFRYYLYMLIVVSFNITSNIYSYLLYLRDISIKLAPPLL